MHELISEPLKLWYPHFKPCWSDCAHWTWYPRCIIQFPHINVRCHYACETISSFLLFCYIITNIYFGDGLFCHAFSAFLKLCFVKIFTKPLWKGCKCTYRCMLLPKGKLNHFFFSQLFWNLSCFIFIVNYFSLFFACELLVVFDLVSLPRD